MTINLLPPETAAKLAAGEVVERPASVVRELVDNALDAGARSISVLVTNGGLDLIRVVDDGGGISRADLRVCTERHATSKIADLDDLTRLSSLGFRGEALHAIAAVSRLRLRSRPAGEPGCEVEYDGLHLTREIASGCPEGTQVEVRHLFFNTPARLKFLRGPTAEATRVEQIMRRYALGRPDVSFRLETDAREVLTTPGNGDPHDAIAAVYGWRIVDLLLPVEAHDHAAALCGFISSPAISRSNRADMHAYVNGRWVQSRALLYAAQEAYSSLLMVGRFPLMILNVSVAPDRLDVNVHPAKNDVRFADERGVSGLVGRTVRAALLAGSAPGAESPVEVGRFSFVSAPPPVPEADPAAPFPGPVEEPEHDRGRSDLADDGRLPPLRILGQLAATYIIAEGPEGLCLVDQHAAHERVLLERLQNRGAAHRESQALLEPIVVPLSPAQAERADEWAEELAGLGFAVEPFGGRSLLVRALPAELPADRVGGLLEALEEGVEGLGTADERRRAVLATAACHGAIRAGQVLDTAEMRQLVRDLELTRVPTACAHGRPTILSISRFELEREFGRKGSR